MAAQIHRKNARFALRGASAGASQQGIGHSYAEAFYDAETFMLPTIGSLLYRDPGSFSCVEFLDWPLSIAG